MPTVSENQNPCARSGQFYLGSLSVAGCLLWLHVEKVHVATEGGQEAQDQTVFGHLQYKHTHFIKTTHGNH